MSKAADPEGEAAFMMGRNSLGVEKTERIV